MIWKKWTESWRGCLSLEIWYDGWRESRLDMYSSSFMNEIICDRGTWLVTPLLPGGAWVRVGPFLASAESRRITRAPSTFSWNKNTFWLLAEAEQLLPTNSGNKCCLLQNQELKRISTSRPMTVELSCPQSFLHHFAMASDIPLPSSHLKRKPSFIR